MRRCSMIRLLKLRVIYGLLMVDGYRVNMGKEEDWKNRKYRILLRRLSMNSLTKFQHINHNISIFRFLIILKVLKIICYTLKEDGLIKHCMTNIYPS